MNGDIQNKITKQVMVFVIADKVSDSKKTTNCVSLTAS